MGVAELPEECLFKDILRLITSCGGHRPRQHDREVGSDATNDEGQGAP
jgi:hypothetical protein